MILAILFVLNAPAISQELQKTIDSLAARLKNHARQDTIRLNLLNEIAFAYYAVSPDAGLNAAEEALALGERLNSEKGMAVAYSRKATNHWALGQDSLAMIAINRSLDYHRTSGNMADYAKGLNNRGLAHYGAGNYLDALHDHEEALIWFEQLNIPLGIKHQWNNMGVVFLALNDYPRALEALLNADRIAVDDPFLQASVWTNIGLVYKNLGEFSKARQYQQQALALYRKSGSDQYIANTLSNIATLLNLSGHRQQAISHYGEAIQMNRKIGNRRKLAGELTNLGAVYNAMDSTARASKLLTEAVSLYRIAKDPNGLSMALLELAATYEAKSTRRISLQEEALTAAIESGSPLTQSHARKALSESYEQTGQYPLALQHHKAYVILRDSVFSEEKKSEIVRQQMQFDFEKKEALSQAEITRQATIRRASLLGAIGLLLAAVLGLILYKRRRDAHARQKEAEFQALVSDTELKALRSQMNPHFIFNSLNSIGDYILKNDTATAQDYLARFAKLMRMVLENSEHTEIPLSDDLSFIELYLQVESKRLPGRFSYSIHVEDGLDTENTMVPPLLLQPFIENSIWHGFRTIRSGGHIAVEIKTENNMLVCCLEDNGSGRNTRRATPGKSLGIAIAERRIEILNKRKNANGDLQIIDKPHNTGTRVALSLPLETGF